MLKIAANDLPSSSVKKFTAPKYIENPSLRGSGILYTQCTSSRDDNRMTGERERKRERENEHRCFATVGWDSSCSWRWIDSKAAAKRPTLLCVFFKPLPLVPAPAASRRANSALHPCLLQPPYHTLTAHPLPRSLLQFYRAGMVYCEPEDLGDRKFPSRAPL